MNEEQENKDYLQPRNHCSGYMLENGVGEPILLTKKAFNSLAKIKNFSDGPYKDTFGDGYGEPYNSRRQAFGKTKKGLFVYCELNEDNDKEVLNLKKRKTLEFKMRSKNKANLSAQEFSEEEDYARRAERDLPG
ncbi:MAG: hypothetical protein IIA85_00375 [Nanoarchaeota archaeon]|nr:hypothetical protein [Nanoarchaeota archaeon]